MKNTTIDSGSSSQQDLTAQQSTKEDKQRKLLKVVIAIFGATAMVGTIILVLKLQTQTLQGFAGCKAGRTLKLKNATLTVVGIEDYKSPQYEDKVCHLTYTQNEVSSEYYLDEVALAKFQNSKAKDVGNGCIIYHIKNTKTKTEFCFGEKVKEK